MLVKGREDASHKCPRADGSNFWSSCFLQEQTSSIGSIEDNVSVMSYVNRMGGTKSSILLQLAKSLWQWCILKGIHLTAQHIPGRPNFTADFMPRHLRDQSDWILDAEIFEMINDRLGPMEVDVFATRFSARLPRFYSWRLDPMAEAADAFLKDWSTSLGYAHPPWCLLSRVLSKVQAQTATLVVIAPFWKTQATSRDACVFSTFAAARAYSSRAVSELRLSGGEENSTTGHVQGIRMRLKTEGISDEAVDLIMASWRRQTLTMTQHGESGKSGVPTKVSIPLLQISLQS